MELSNTLIVEKMPAGRPASAPRKTIAGSCSGAGWTDRTANFVTDGYTLDGTTNPGPYAINVTNDNEIYSFHPEERRPVRRRLGPLPPDTLDIRVVARLITAAANEAAVGFE